MPRYLKHWDALHGVNVAPASPTRDAGASINQRARGYKFQLGEIVVTPAGNRYRIIYRYPASLKIPTEPGYLAQKVIGRDKVIGRPRSFAQSALSHERI